MVGGSRTRNLAIGALDCTLVHRFDAESEVLAEAVRRGGPTRRGIQRGLASVKGLNTVLGTFEFDENRDAVHHSWVRVVQQGHFVVTAAG